MHQRLFGLSPFEVIFRRKTNENVECIKNIEDLYTPSVGEKSYATWKKRVKNLRNDAEGMQKLSRDKMISWHGEKLGDKVLVKMKISDKKTRGKHKTFDII